VVRLLLTFPGSGLAAAFQDRTVNYVSMLAALGSVWIVLPDPFIVLLGSFSPR
jgi:hypothetical protein